MDAFDAREYTPIDKDDREALNELRNQAQRSRYIFRVADIERVEHDVGALYKSFVSFHNAKLTRKMAPQPFAGFP